MAGTDSSMKRYLLLGIALAITIIGALWLRSHKSANSQFSDAPEASTPQLPVTRSGQLDGQPRIADAQSAQAEAERESIAQRAELARKANEAGNPQFSFYIKVVDQDSNALSGVAADVTVIEEYADPFAGIETKKTPLEKRTGPDGRFEIDGLKGKYILVQFLTKEGYEPEHPFMAYGMFGVQSTSITTPLVLRMWSTNVHANLVTGEKSFIVVPDGRRYGIDLVSGTITEGSQGDLVTSIQRPQRIIGWRERYDWSCELNVPQGGLVETQAAAMFTAPDVGYSNSFTYFEPADANGWGDLTGEKRFYVKLRDGRAYGRIIVNLFANYDRQQSGMIRISFAVNPSGSRLLREATPMPQLASPDDPGGPNMVFPNSRTVPHSHR
jgi:hypothetical protein